MFCRCERPNSLRIIEKFQNFLRRSFPIRICSARDLPPSCTGTKTKQWKHFPSFFFHCLGVPHPRKPKAGGGPAVLGVDACPAHEESEEVGAGAGGAIGHKGYQRRSDIQKLHNRTSNIQSRLLVKRGDGIKSLSHTKEHFPPPRIILQKRSCEQTLRGGVFLGKLYVVFISNSVNYSSIKKSGIFESNKKPTATTGHKFHPKARCHVHVPTITGHLRSDSEKI